MRTTIQGRDGELSAVNNMALLTIDTIELEEVPESRAKLDVWRVEPSLTSEGSIGEVLEINQPSILAAHVLATVRGSALADIVKYRTNYPLSVAGRSKICDLEYRGTIYRSFQDRIYTKRVGQ